MLSVMNCAESARSKASLAPRLNIYLDLFSDSGKSTTNTARIFSLLLYSFYSNCNISIDQTFYSAMHYITAVWIDSRYDSNIILRIREPYDTDIRRNESRSTLEGAHPKDRGPTARALTKPSGTRRSIAKQRVSIPMMTARSTTASSVAW